MCKFFMLLFGLILGNYFVALFNAPLNSLKNNDLIITNF
jgi:hypothetical protein